MNKEKIKKVHVVYKTHLDIGFTDMGQTVLDRYVKEYIPHSIDLAFALNTETEKLFIWTVGSFLIDYFLKHADKENCEKLKLAIQRGDICWHGLTSTTHTELLDEDLYEFGLCVSDRLDKAFGKKTIAAKMTDVPGHTKAMIKGMADHGTVYLHLGVNPSSMVPDVPETFLWKANDAEIMVQYSFSYGQPCYFEGMDEVLEFAHTGDNLGPQSKEDIEEEIARIQKIYPNAAVVASTMDAYAQVLLLHKDSMPVVEEEIADTWIHGVGTDPLKIARYKELLAQKDRWKAEGRFDIKDEAVYEFMMNLLLVAEHTWGLDYKKYLADFSNWDKVDFQAARKADVTTLDFLTNRNAHMLLVLEDDIKKYRNGTFTGSYQMLEQSYAEQMAYIYKAVDGLPNALQIEAKNLLSKMDAQIKAPMEVADQVALSYPGARIVIGDWTVSFAGDGAVSYLEKSGKQWIREGSFGRLVYSTYDAVDCVNNYYRYNRDFRNTQSWSEGDFGKPGVEFAQTLSHREYTYGLRKIAVCDNTITILLEADCDAATLFGAPRRAKVVYVFGETLDCKLFWQGKDANRMPEALWFDMQFDVANPYRWKMKKLGQYMSPLDVAKGGNRRQHCVEEMHYTGADGEITVKNIHAPLISVGGRWLYGDYRQLPQITDGFSYCLFNNKWGTNFKMWCEEDCSFEFSIAIS